MATLVSLSIVWFLWALHERGEHGTGEYVIRAAAFKQPMSDLKNIKINKYYFLVTESHRKKMWFKNWIERPHVEGSGLCSAFFVHAVESEDESAG